MKFIFLIIQDFFQDLDEIIHPETVNSSILFLQGWKVLIQHIHS